MTAGKNNDDMLQIGDTGKTVEVTGIIIPVEWDDNANPVQFALSAYDEQEYLIDNLSSLCTTPHTLLRKKIKVYGKRGKTIKKRIKLTITKYDVLKE